MRIAPLSAIDNLYEAVILNSTVWPTVTGTPGAGDADSSLIEYPSPAPFTNVHGIGPSAAIAEEAKTKRAKAGRTRILILPPQLLRMHRFEHLRPLLAYPRSTLLTRIVR